MNSTRVGLLVTVVAGALVLSGCTPASPESVETTTGAQEGIGTGEYGGQTLEIGEPISGGEFDFGMSVPVEALDSNGLIGGSGELPMSLIYDRLMKFTEAGAVVPELAESLETTDNVTWTLKLPEGVTFTDGTPFDAEAVVKQVERVAAESSQSFNALDARQVTAMDTPDELTVVFTLAAPNSQFNVLLATGSLSMIASPTAVEAAGADFALNPVGAGPFMVESFSPSGDIVLKANPDYRIEGLPYLDTLKLVPTVEEASRISAVSAGDLDGATLAVQTQLQDARDAGLTVLDQPWYSYTTVVPNMTSAPLDDVRVRTAINEAIDRDAINTVVYGGLQDPMSGVLTPTQPFFEDTGWPEFDLEAATALVDEVEKETGPISLRLLTNQTQEAGQISALLQQMLGAAGIDLEYSAATPTTQVTAALTGDFDLLMMDQGVPAETTARLRTLFGSDQPLNFGKVGNPDLDALLDEASQAASNDERTALIPSMQETLTEWVPVVPLVAGALGRILGPDVKGFPDGIPQPTSQDLFDARYIWVAE